MEIASLQHNYRHLKMSWLCNDVIPYFLLHAGDSALHALYAKNTIFQDVDHFLHCLSGMYTVKQTPPLVTCIYCRSKGCGPMDLVFSHAKHSSQCGKYFILNKVTTQFYTASDETERRIPHKLLRTEYFPLLIKERSFICSVLLFYSLV